MDGSILKKVNVYPAGNGQLGQIQSPNYTEVNVISADIGVFHQTPQTSRKDKPAELPELDYAAGLRDGKAKSDLVYQNTISVMQKALDAFKVEIKTIAAQIEFDHLSALNACLTSAVPSLMKHGTGAEIHKLIAQTSEATLNGDVHFRVHPDDHEDCQRLCEMKRTGIIVTADSSLSAKQIKVEWQNGGAEINSGEIFETFLQSFENVLKTLNSDYHAERNNG
ncbi:MAG: hypothetical protein ACSHXY_02275 [Alphaproteobacteria bacterium]